MRAVVQRVARAHVEVEGRVISAISKGIAVLVGVEKGDGQPDVDYMAAKLAALRIFEDCQGKMNLSALDTGADILLVSQFTLFGDARRGNRPSFIGAEDYETGRMLCGLLSETLKKKTALNIQDGLYGADMRVCIENDGPVTILLDSRKLF